MSLEEVERWLGTYLNYTPGQSTNPASTPIACACGLPH
jgi:hypothetical protein